MTRSARVLVVSTRAANGVYEDRTGPVIVGWLRERGFEVQIEVVAYGPGLNMLREDKSPVKDRIKKIVEGSYPSKVQFTACGNTITNMEKAEGHPVQIIAQASIVLAGVVRLSELQEEGWSYIRP